VGKLLLANLIKATVLPYILEYTAAAADGVGRILGLYRASEVPILRTIMGATATLLLSFLISSHALCAAEVTATVLGPALQAELVKLDLADLGDVLLLNAEERDELKGALKVVGIPLGARSRFRRVVEDTGFRRLPTDERSSIRRVQEEPTAAKKESGGFSFETLAIAVTALMGLISYALQAKLARDTEHSDKEHDRYLADREKDRVQADRLLERVRSSLADAMFPMSNRLHVGIYCEWQLQYDLDLPCLKKFHRDKLYVRPLAAWPDLVVKSGAHPAEFFTIMTKSPFTTYEPEDFAVLAGDEAKRDRWVDTWRDCILPQWRVWGDLYMQSRHLLDLPPMQLLSETFAPAEIDWLTFLGGSAEKAAYAMVQWIGAWVPVLKRWAAADFSVMQPTEPNFSLVLFIMNIAMLGAAGQKEKVKLMPD
jgi:hypothetical protein